VADANFPNNLRARREEAVLTRAQLAAMTKKLAARDEVLYKSVSERSLERLERGEVQPQTRTAKTLAKALGCSVSSLFPLQTTNQARNPRGRNRSGASETKASELPGTTPTPHEGDEGPPTHLTDT
jgi:transcriptional regulator with XRE-family HTH domain